MSGDGEQQETIFAAWRFYQKSEVALTSMARTHRANEATAIIFACTPHDDS